MTAKTDRLATRVEGIRPPVPAANSSDAGTNALATDIAAAENIIDPRDLPPVMLGPGSTRDIDAHLARVACGGCGQPKPSSAASDDRTPSRGKDSPITAENAAHLRRVLRNNIQSLQEVADDLRIEGPFPDCAERDLLVATARAVIRHATGGVS